MARVRRCRYPQGAAARGLGSMLLRGSSNQNDSAILALVTLSSVPLTTNSLSAPRCVLTAPAIARCHRSAPTRTRTILSCPPPCLWIYNQPRLSQLLSQHSGSSICCPFPMEPSAAAEPPAPSSNKIKAFTAGAETLRRIQPCELKSAAIITSGSFWTEIKQATVVIWFNIRRQETGEK